MCRPLSVEELEYEKKWQAQKDVEVCPDCGYENHPDELEVRQDFIDPQVDNYYCIQCGHPVGNSKSEKE